MTTRRTGRIGVIATAIVLTLGACGVDSKESAPAPESPETTVVAPSTEPTAAPEPDDSSSAPEPGEAADESALNLAADQTLEARSFRISGTSAMAMNGGVGATITMEGSFDAENGISHLIMEVDSDVGGGILGDMQLESIETPDTSYFRGPAMFGGSGDDWIVEPIDEAAETRAAMPVQSPNGVFEFLRSSRSEIDEIGSEEVRGEPTTHLRTVLDLQGAIDAETNERIARIMTDWVAVMEMQTAGPFDSIEMDIWVGDDGYLRKIAYDVELLTGPVESELEFFDFGEPVDIEVPDAG